MRTKHKREARFLHGLITILAMAAMMFYSIVVLEISPHMPLVFGCLVAGLMAARLGYTWDEILEGILAGIGDSLEAILILLLIGMLVGTWIAAGTVPAMICYGLTLVSPRLFLPAAMLICTLVAFAIGSWGTVGTIGLAFMGMGLTLGLPAPFVAGAVISGAYMGEVISPLSDATNLAAAVTGGSVFTIVKRILPCALPAGVLTLLLYGLRGGSLTAEEDALEASIAPILTSLRAQFHITPWALLPMAMVLLCILLKVPAIPAMLSGILAGLVQAALLQKVPLGEGLTCAYSGYVSLSGNDMLDTLLTTGGMAGMMESISIILIAMAFGGIMKKTSQMDALVRPLVTRIRGRGGMTALTVLTCVGMNAVLPDQYLGISMPGQMYGHAAEELGFSREELAAVLLGGGAVTSPLIPWNTCGIYCMTILGISPLRYAPFAFYGMLLPIVTILMGTLPRKER